MPSLGQVQRDVAASELDVQRQAVLDLKLALEELDEELAAAREANRRLMNQVNRART